MAHSDADRDREYTVVLFLGGPADDVAVESRDGLVIAIYKYFRGLLDLDCGVKTGGRERALLEKKIVSVSKSRHCRRRYRCGFSKRRR